MATQRPLSLVRLCGPLARHVWPVIDKFVRRLAWRCRCTWDAIGPARHRAIWTAMGLRLAWWLALACAIHGWRVLVDIHQPLVATRLPLPFVVGMVLCAVVVLLSRERHLRVAAAGLGMAHGTAAALVYSALG